MNRRQYLRAAAVLLGTGAAATGPSRADDDDEVYETVVAKFDDVTAFRSPLSGSEGDGEPIYRLYDAETETLAYATAAGTGGERSVSLVTRDASEVEFAA